MSNKNKGGTDCEHLGQEEKWGLVYEVLRFGANQDVEPTPKAFCIAVNCLERYSWNQFFALLAWFYSNELRIVFFCEVFHLCQLYKWRQILFFWSETAARAFCIPKQN